MTALDLPSPPRILVIVLRRLGDVLLTTALIRSLKCGYPDARIDVLVFAGTEGVLEGNPDVSAIIVMPRSGLLRTLALATQLWRRYDLAVSTQTGDRPTFFAWVGGRRRAGPVEAAGLVAHMKRRMLDRSVTVSHGSHRVEETLRLAQALGIAAGGELVCPAGSPRTEQSPPSPYAVVHAAPMFRYKQWTVDGWRALASTLTERGIAIAATGGPSEQDRRYLDEVWRGLDVHRLDGRLSWPELSNLIRGAQVYVGPDTSVTHLAAAAGGPTVAIYGPTDPRLWGPWPAAGLAPPWMAAGTLQQRGNVWLVQNPLPCLPCQLEGCERRLNSHSQCLEELTVAQVLGAVDAALAWRQRR
jgi:heptosyltransferase-3